MRISKLSIRPTVHYLDYHSDVKWDLVIHTIMSPTKVLVDRRYGKDRMTYIKKTKNCIIKVHTKNDELEGIIWVINAFGGENEMSKL